MTCTTDLLPGTWLTEARARGLNVEFTSDGKLRVTPASEMTDADCAYLADHGHLKALLALDALDTSQRRQAAKADAELKQVIADRERRHAERQRRHNADVMATWSPEKVRTLAERGDITAEDVAAWEKAVRERKHRAAVVECGIALSLLTGRQVHFEWEVER